MPKLLDRIRCDTCNRKIYYIVSETCVECDEGVAWSLPNIPRCKKDCNEQKHYDNGLCYYHEKIRTLRISPPDRSKLL